MERATEGEDVMTKHVLYGIEYKKQVWDNETGKLVRSETAKELYGSTSAASLFDTKGKANARLKTHFKNGEDERQARVVKFELKEIEE